VRERRFGRTSFRAERDDRGGLLPRPCEALDMGSKHATIFLVDDDDELREGLEALLEGEGYLVLGARSGAEALARMQGSYGSSIAVIDLHMPGMNG
jgi:response regulator RpfG family c-di-GMP phosphodiesterase